MPTAPHRVRVRPLLELLTQHVWKGLSALISCLLLDCLWPSFFTELFCLSVEYTGLPLPLPQVEVIALCSVSPPTHLLPSCSKSFHYSSSFLLPPASVVFGGENSDQSPFRPSILSPGPGTEWGLISLDGWREGREAEEGQSVVPKFQKMHAISILQLFSQIKS